MRFSKESLDVIRKKLEMIEYSTVYWELRKYGMKRVKEPTVSLTRECLAIYFAGCPYITVSLVESIHRPTTNIYNLLHRLGDYRVLTLIRDNQEILRFTINPQFLEKIRLRLPEEVTGGSTSED